VAVSREDIQPTFRRVFMNIQPERGKERPCLIQIGDSQREVVNRMNCCHDNIS
jgi:hypothetical protein